MSIGQSRTAHNINLLGRHKKLLPKRIFNNIYVPELAPTEAVKMPFQKESAVEAGPKKHPSSEFQSGPYGSCQDVGLSKRNYYQTGSSTTSNYRGGPRPLPKLSRRPLPKRNCCLSGNTTKSNNRSGPLLKLLRRAPSNKKLLLKRTLKHIHLPERALRKLSKQILPKRNCCQTGPSTTSNYRGGPLLKLSRRVP